MVFIADYGAGNLRSVLKAFDYLGVKAEVSSDPAKLAGYRKVVLPGVGAFGQAIESLNASGFTEAVDEHVDKGGQLLGICLGMQLLLTDSEEMGVNKGMNLIRKATGWWNRANSRFGFAGIPPPAARRSLSW